MGHQSSIPSNQHQRCGEHLWDKLGQSCHENGSCRTSLSVCWWNFQSLWAPTNACHLPIKFYWFVPARLGVGCGGCGMSSSNRHNMEIEIQSRVSKCRLSGRRGGSEAGKRRNCRRDGTSQCSKKIWMLNLNSPIKWCLSQVWHGFTGTRYTENQPRQWQISFGKAKALVGSGNGGFAKQHLRRPDAGRAWTWQAETKVTCVDLLGKKACAPVCMYICRIDRIRWDKIRQDQVSL
jgi:hypothetical protein